MAINKQHKHFIQKHHNSTNIKDRYLEIIDNLNNLDLNNECNFLQPKRKVMINIVNIVYYFGNIWCNLIFHKEYIYSQEKLQKNHYKGYKFMYLSDNSNIQDRNMENILHQLKHKHLTNIQCRYCDL